MSWPSMFAFGSAIFHASNPLKNVSSEFVLLCKKAAPFHFIQAAPRLVLPVLIGNFANIVACFSRIVSHPIAKSHVKPWSVREHDATWVRLLLPFVFEQLRLIKNTSEKSQQVFSWGGHGLFGLILAAPLVGTQFQRIEGGLLKMFSNSFQVLRFFQQPLTISQTYNNVSLRYFRMPVL